MIFEALMQFVHPCWKPTLEEEGSSKNGDTSGRFKGLLWYKDSGKNASGEFSMAVIQANNVLEDHSQVEIRPIGLLDSSPQGIFVGIYDGHGGPEAARFVNDHLFRNIREYASKNQIISADVITKAFIATEEAFLALVRKEWLTKPQLASVGSCCLVGIVCGGKLYIANAGDSRVVLGQLDKATKEVKALQLSTEHNASHESVREQLCIEHPDDPRIVVLKHEVWRVKGLIQISRSIGDAYLKNAEFNKEPLLPKFRLPEPFHKPILRADPSVYVKNIHPEDKFLIFASDGLWDHLSNQEAVDIVKNNPRNGIAKRLVKTALHEAAKKREMRYEDLEKICKGVRRHFHDDITVIVLYLDSHMMSHSLWHSPRLSRRNSSISNNTRALSSINQPSNL